MKIVVSRVDDDLATGWHWWIVDGNKIVAESSAFYTRKSDAKRGAERFEDKLFGEYIRRDEGGYKTMEQRIAIEVLD